MRMKHLQCFNGFRIRHFLTPSLSRCSIQHILRRKLRVLHQIQQQSFTQNAQPNIKPESRNTPEAGPESQNTQEAGPESQNIQEAEPDCHNTQLSRSESQSTQHSESESQNTRHIELEFQSIQHSESGSQNTQQNIESESLNTQRAECEPRNTQPNIGSEPPNTQYPDPESTDKAEVDEIIPSFGELGLCEELRENLKQMGILEPTWIQAKAFSTIRSGKPTVVGAETGSGKTLAYLLPVVEAALKHARGRSLAMRRAQYPEFVVLAPTRELCVQLTKVARSLTQGLPVRAYSRAGDEMFESVSMTTRPSYMDFDAGPPQAKRTVHRNPDEPVRILFATPACVWSSLKRFPKWVALIRYLVLDEADMMLAESMKKREPLQRIFKNIDAYQSNVSDQRDNPLFVEMQRIYVAASIPNRGLKSVDAWLHANNPNLQWARSAGLHRPRPRLTEQWTRATEEDTDGHVALSEALRATGVFARDMGVPLGSFRTLVFANSGGACEKAGEMLRAQGTSVYVIPPRMKIEEKNEILERYYESPMSVLITTDVMARGIDFTDVQHVIQLNFCNNVTQYIHRIGRTARNGKPGIATHIYNESSSMLADSIRSSDSIDRSFSRRGSLAARVYSKERKAKKEERRAEREAMCEAMRHARGGGKLDFEGLEKMFSRITSEEQEDTREEQEQVTGEEQEHISYAAENESRKLEDIDESDTSSGGS
eukprot:192215_1